MKEKHDIELACVPQSVDDARPLTQVEYYAEYGEYGDVIHQGWDNAVTYFFPKNVTVLIEYVSEDGPLRYANIRAYVKDGSDWKEVKTSYTGCRSNGGPSGYMAVEVFFKVTGLSPYEGKTIKF